jgi:twitching motility two-component system response regulator PilH
VDENASIRRSAEILLGGTDLEMVAVESAEEALGQLASGKVFDVALIHAFLPGEMDGWALLAHLRKNPATARLPIALMAGVLKEVDPVQIAEAPIQGFLRKPIELGNLRDRLATIMAMPVPEPSPEPKPAFETVPGAPLDHLLQLPETRPEEAPMERDDDVLILEVEDLFPGDATPVPPIADMPEESLELEAAGDSDSLELEELDLEALRVMSPAPPQEFEALPVVAPSSFQAFEEEPAKDAWSGAPRSELTPLETPPLPDLESTWEDVPAMEPDFEPAFEPEPAAVFLSEVEASEGTVDLPDLGGDVDAELDLGPDTPEWSAAPVMASFAAPVEAPEPPLPPAPVAEPMAAAIPSPPHALVASPSPGVGDAQALVQALIADPAAMDALCRAVVAELGTRALQEIAWEIMPGLAKKLP